MDYPAIGADGLLVPGCLLFLIYGVSVVLRTTLQRQRITVFETGQTMIAFLLASSSVLYFAPRHGAKSFWARPACCFRLPATRRPFCSSAKPPQAAISTSFRLGRLPASGRMPVVPAALLVCDVPGSGRDRGHSFRIPPDAQVAWPGLFAGGGHTSGLMKYAFACPRRNSAREPHVERLPGCRLRLVCYAAGKRGSRELDAAVDHLATAALAVFALAALLVRAYCVW